MGNIRGAPSTSGDVASTIILLLDTIDKDVDVAALRRDLEALVLQVCNLSCNVSRTHQSLKAKQNSSIRSLGVRILLDGVDHRCSCEQQTEQLRTEYQDLLDSTKKTRQAQVTALQHMFDEGWKQGQHEGCLSVQCSCVCPLVAVFFFVLRK